jgi:hypothetical protein
MGKGSGYRAFWIFGPKSRVLPNIGPCRVAKREDNLQI